MGAGGGVDDDVRGEVEGHGLRGVVGHAVEVRLLRQCPEAADDAGFAAPRGVDFKLRPPGFVQMGQRLHQERADQARRPGDEDGLVVELRARAGGGEAFAVKGLVEHDVSFRSGVLGMSCRRFAPLPRCGGEARRAAQRRKVRPCAPAALCQLNLMFSIIDSHRFFAWRGFQSPGLKTRGPGHRPDLETLRASNLPLRMTTKWKRVILSAAKDLYMPTALGVSIGEFIMVRTSAGRGRHKWRPCGGESGNSTPLSSHSCSIRRYALNVSRSSLLVSLMFLSEPAANQRVSPRSTIMVLV